MTTLRRFRILVTVVAAVLTMGAPRLVAAQEAAPRAKAKPSAKAAGNKARASENPKRVLRLEELKVEGRIRKPQAMFLMPRANLTTGDLERGESFLPKLAEPLKSQPF